MCLASTMPFSTRNRCQNKSLNWCRVCVFSNTEVTKIGISKSKTGIVDIRINISTIKCLGSGHIFRVGRGTGNTQLIYLRLSPCTKKILCRLLNIQVYLGGKMINDFIPLIKPWDFQQ